MKSRYLFHALAVVLVSWLIGLLFLREPGFGDDFTYWSFGFELHEDGLHAWQKNSFHDLRWPVWGICWLIQSLTPIGLVSYFGEPLLYLGARALLAFYFGRLLTQSVATAWSCAIAFLFHPLLDTVCYRPMPDLSEGVLGAAVLLSWWLLMNARSRGATIALSVLTGVAIYVAESNRITGVFIIPVLVLCTLVCFPRNFGRLLVAGGIAAVCYGAECWFYHRLFHDWLHNLHANLGGKGNKGTEPIPVWFLPFRFFDSLWNGSPLAPLYCIFGLIGIWHALRKLGAPGRIIVIWFTTLYLEYACAPQSLWPWRPLIRDADRFLCGLAVPMSVLAAVGFICVISFPWLRHEGGGIWIRGRWIRIRALPIGIAVTCILLLLTSRERFNLGFVPEMRAYLRSRTQGTKVFTHSAMRELSFLVDSSAAKKIQWTVRPSILQRDPASESAAAQSDEFWYIRKLIWLNTRKALERKSIGEQAQLASYFETPEHEWTMTRLLAKADTPDLIFYQRRKSDTPPAQIFEVADPKFGEVIPSLPAEWKKGRDPQNPGRTWKVPPEWQGQFARIEIEAASEQVEAVAIRLRFMHGEKLAAEYLLKPYLHPEPGKEFFAFQIPQETDHCDVHLRFSKNAQLVKFTGFRTVLEKANGKQLSKVEDTAAVR